jgi:hypothetical protein
MQFQVSLLVARRRCYQRLCTRPIAGIRSLAQSSKKRRAPDAEIGKGTSHGDIAKTSTGMDANLKQMRALHGEIVKQNNKLDFQTKMQSLAFAIENAERNSFEFNFTHDHGQFANSSSELVVKILLAFRLGPNWHCNIASGYGTMSPIRFMSKSDGAKSQQEFRDRVSRQIHELTGVKPRFEYMKEEEQYHIFYS